VVIVVLVGAVVVPDEALIVFTPSGRRGRFPVGTPVLQAARSLGVDIDSVCGGRALCGRCQVVLQEGEFAKHGVSSRAAHLSDQSDDEREFVAQGGVLADGRRLSCSTLIQGDVVIDVPPDSQVHRQVVRKRAEVMDIELDPIVRLYFIEVQEPDMHDPASDLRRIYEALDFEWGLKGVNRCDLHVLRVLQRALRDGDWKITVAVHDGARIIGVWSGLRSELYGLAVDVGSTTIAAHLCALGSGDVVASSGVMNPQIRFGEDLMSRVSYIMMQPGSDVEMTAAVRGALRQLASEVAREAGISTNDIIDITLVGNPIMHHLLLGIDPIELGGAPFALATEDAVNVRASELEIGIHPGARAYVLPCVAGHVGADTAGVMLSEQPHLVDAVTLLVDVGTNAEIVLGNKERLLACSSPTGPAFEGAQISSGQRAAPGAIERVRIDPETLEPRFCVIGSELWSDEPGFDEAVAATGVNGICGSGIIEVIAEMYLAGIITTDGVVRADQAARSNRVVAEGRTYAYQLWSGATDIRITQNDVRAIQLAKAALYAGIQLLMDRLRVDKVDRIRLAGAFGSHIDVKYAMVLGLVPDCDLEHVTSAGNAAGTGARIALLDRKARDEIEALVRRVEKVETAVEPRFQEHFVAAMAIPHKTAEFPELAKVVKLPELATDPRGSADGRRRRRRRQGA
jgi:uncharacterized 2Fe-2S/4Fe-4S cluster protein (DUF4445 family)